MTLLQELGTALIMFILLPVLCRLVFGSIIMICWKIDDLIGKVMRG